MSSKKLSGVEHLIEAMRHSWNMDGRECINAICRLKELRRYCDVELEMVDAYISVLEKRREHQAKEEARMAVHMSSDFINVCPKCETNYGPCDCT